MRNEYTKKLISISLGINAVKLDTKNPFLWASGYYMPIYNDNRIFLQEKKYRELIADSFIEMMKDNNIEVDVIAGTSTSGIPLATTLADKLDLPLTYVRDKPKGHGLKNCIEGIPAETGYQGKKVLLIEDLISTGGSSIKAVQAIRDADGNIDCCLSIFSYGFKEADINFSSLKPRCRSFSIITYEDLIAAAVEDGYISNEEFESLKEWRVDTFGWGENHGFGRIKKPGREQASCSAMQPKEGGK